MKRSVWILLSAILFLLSKPVHAQSGGGKGVDLASELPSDAHQLKIGDAAPDFSLKGVDGKTYTLADFKDSPILMVAFLSNHCPYSHAADSRLVPMAEEFKPKGVAVVAINPNDPTAVDVGELGYSKYNDSYDEMKLYAKDRAFPFPYLYDGDAQKTAKAYGCLCTPDIFIFDQSRHLRYMGRLDDSRFPDSSTVKSTDARNAVEALLAGKSVPVEVTKPFGCSTKWIENKPKIAQINEKWNDSPVTLEPIDVEGVKKLVKNDTNKVRLINLWATWCAPCVAEFPNLVSISRRLANRDFELITLTVDDPSDQAKALAFLEKQHAATPGRTARQMKAEGRDTNNYIYSGTDLDALMQAIDPQAPGPVPYTIIIAPGGKILYRRGGTIDHEEVLAKLIDALGVYYTSPPAQTASTPPAH
jgi:thiol-disulfide isomerase/thioredoxin